MATRQTTWIRQTSAAAIPDTSVFNTTIAFLLGFSAVLYLQVYQYLKVIDVFTLVAIAGTIVSPSTPSRSSFFLFASYVTVCVAALINPDYASLNLKPYVSSMAAIVLFFIVNTMSYRELKYLLIGFSLSLVSILAWTIMATYSLAPDFGMDLWYRSRYGASIIGTMTDPNRFALAILVPTAVASSFIMMRKRLLLSMSFLAFFVVGLWMTQSRAGIGLGLAMSFAATGSMMVWTRFFRKGNVVTKLFAILLATFSLFAAAALFFSNNPVLQWKFEESQLGRKFVDKGSSYYDDPRWYLTELGLESASEDPFGIGMEGYKNKYRYTSHNTYIETLVNGGIFALLFQLVFLGAVGYRVFSSWNVDAKLGKNWNESWFFNFRVQLFVAIALFQFTLQINYLSLAYLILGIVSNDRIDQILIKRKHDPGLVLQRQLPALDNSASQIDLAQTRY